MLESAPPNMKRAALILAVVIFVVGSFFAYRAVAKRRDLKETILWIDQTYNPHEGGENYGRGHGDETHYLQDAKLHTEEVTQEFHETFAYRGDCNVVLHHETVPIGLFKNVYTTGDYTLSLCDVDLDSIKIKTYDFHKDVFSCADPEEVKSYELNCTSAEVEFYMRNGAPKIKDDSVTTYVQLTGKNHEAQHHGYMSKGWFAVDDVTYAERLVKAFRHAVELCGGKTSKF
jgi:hypothetical protein